LLIGTIFLGIGASICRLEAFRTDPLSTFSGAKKREYRRPAPEHLNRAQARIDGSAFDRRSICSRIEPTPRSWSPVMMAGSDNPGADSACVRVSDHAPAGRSG